MWLDHDLFICPSVNKRLDQSHLLGVLNSAAVTVHGWLFALLFLIHVGPSTGLREVGQGLSQISKAVNLPLWTVELASTNASQGGRLRDDRRWTAPGSSLHLGHLVCTLSHSFFFFPTHFLPPLLVVTWAEDSLVLLVSSLTLHF